MNDEFNRQEWKNTLPEEQKNYREYMPCGDNASSREFPSASEDKEIPNVTSKKKRENPSGGIGRLLSLLTTAVTAVAAVAVIAPVVAETDKTVVNFAEMYSTDTSIGYFISLENRSEAALRLVVYNDFTRRETPIEGTEIAGEETGLKPGVYYRVAVMKGNRTLAETKLRTKREEEIQEIQQEESETVFRSVRWESTYAVDGCFRFQMDFVDENGYWWGFSALLTDSADKIWECEFTEDLHGEQIIEIFGSVPETPITFRIFCFSSQPDENGEFPSEAPTILLYEMIVEI